ncbi:DNA/RNA non-specific endonuclease [Cronobacter turicensis]|nr:DNA/RNA non-specific endonuclease [Cronobacter turicensis]
MPLFRKLKYYVVDTVNKMVGSLFSEGATFKDYGFPFAASSELKNKITDNNEAGLGFWDALTYTRDISLSTAQDMERLKNHSGGSQATLGAGFSLGGSQNGITIEAGASSYSNKDKGNSLTHHNSVVTAEDTLTVHTGRDATLQGAELRGQSVKADIGRDLLISSQQDKNQYDSKTSSGGVSVSVCVPPICAGNFVQGSANAAGGKVTHDFKSVIEQSGIFVGTGGFDVHVGEHTQLNGAVIASDADATKNRLDTGTLGWNDIHNKSQTSGNQFAVSVSGGMTKDASDKLKPTSSGLPGTSLASVSDSDSNITHSAVSQGAIIIRDKDKQTQDVAELSRDTTHAHKALENNFDKASIQDKLDIQNQASALGTQALDAWRQSQLEAGKDKIRAAMQASGELDGLTDAQINGKIAQSDQYKEVDKQYGVGSDFWRNGSAITGLLAGALGGNLKGGMAAGAAPYVAGLIKSAANGSEPARIALHMLASAVLVKAQGGNAAAGAAGGFVAASSSAALSAAFYNKKPEELSPDEKTVIANLVAALGAAGGSMAAGNSTGIGSGANAARVEVENNSVGDLHDQLVSGESQIDKFKKQLKIDEEKFSQENCAGISAEACTVKFYDHRRKELNEISSFTADFVPGIGTLKSVAEAESALDYLEAAASLIPGERVVAGALKAAKKALVKGNLDEAIKFIYKADNEIIAVSGRKGNWSKELNNPLPNKTYKVDGNKTYVTDNHGRVASVEADLLLLTKDHNKYQQCKAGKCGVSGDGGGHLIASIFGGLGEKLNIVPMNGNLNKGAWKQMENTWATALKEGKQVKVKIDPVYSVSSVRPDKFTIQYQIGNNKPIRETFQNAPGGK